jgi:hypothetical protein
MERKHAAESHKLAKFQRNRDFGMCVYQAAEHSRTRAVVTRDHEQFSSCHAIFAETVGGYAIA